MSELIIFSIGFYINTLYIKSSQVKYIYIALFTIQIVSQLLQSINQDNLTVFVYYWKKKDIKVW